MADNACSPFVSFTCRERGFGFRASGFGFRVSGFGFQVSGFRFRVLGFGLRADHEGGAEVDEDVPKDPCRVEGLGLRF